jgi:hypothetical protein
MWSTETVCTRSVNRKIVEVLLNFLMVRVRIFLLPYDILQFPSYDSSAGFCVDYRDVHLRSG